MSKKTPLRFFSVCAALALIMTLGTVSPVSADESKDKADDKASVRVLMKTTLGDMVFELNREKAPISVDNFLRYTDKGFYDGTIFHRVMSNFMIQGGGFTSDMRRKETNPPIKNEWQNGLKNVKGSIAMARRGQQPNSATSQFFINVKNNAALDQPRDGSGYAVFGKVVEGMDVVEKIRKAKTTTVAGRPNVPAETILIEKVLRLDKKGKPIERPAPADSTAKK